MENRYTGAFEHVEGWWIGHVEELPGCNVQERTLEEARESLKEVIQANRDLATRGRRSSGHRQTAAVPRHTEIVMPVVNRICKDLGVSRAGD